MKRRDVLAGLGVLLGAANVDFALAQSHDHHHAHASPAPTALISSSADCVIKGRACLNHCFALIAAGDTAIVECARQVNELIAACQALNALALANSKNLVVVAKAVRSVCASCEAECRKHADKHAECKACAESCANCLKEIDKLA